MPRSVPTLVTAALLMAAVHHKVHGFQTGRLCQGVGSPRTTTLPPTTMYDISSSSSLYRRKHTWLAVSDKDDDVDNFDGQGFANYLAPYALALLASIGVTALFVKFVLLDY